MQYRVTRLSGHSGDQLMVCSDDPRGLLQPSQSCDSMNAISCKVHQFSYKLSAIFTFPSGKLFTIQQTSKALKYFSKHLKPISHLIWLIIMLSSDKYIIEICESSDYLRCLLLTSSHYSIKSYPILLWRKTSES